ncbi:MAG TPA: heavy metal-binding domain-containing protein [Abditibacterium sp.]
MTSKSSPLPVSVVQRLEEQRARIEAGAFTSSFGVGEWLLSRAGGYEALGQVMGATTFQIGTQWTSPLWRNSSNTQTNQPSWAWRKAKLTPAQLQAQKRGFEMEITTHTAAYVGARRAALERLQAEAALLGASGVAGVRLSMRISRGASSSGANRLEFVAIGTAVKSPRLRRSESVWLSNLSGQELWQLESAGWAPCGFVGGNCSYFRALSYNTAALLTGILMRVDQETYDFATKQRLFRFLNLWRFNFEVSEYSEAVYKARELAISRLEDEARACKADGIVGLKIELDEEAHLAVPASGIMTPSISFSFLALGTAIRRENIEPKGEISAILNLK